MSTSLENSNLSFAMHAYFTKIVFHSVACKDILPYLCLKAAFANPQNRLLASHSHISQLIWCGRLAQGSEVGKSAKSVKNRSAINQFLEIDFRPLK
jgi:hypothetical protein